MASQDCQVCLEPYDEDQRKPRCLSCGHTLCTTCVADCLTRGQLQCPFCRHHHATQVSCAADVPVNYTVINLLQDVNYSRTKKKSEALLAEVKKEANDFTTTQLVSCNHGLARLRDFQQQLNEQHTVHQGNLGALRCLVERHESLLQDMTAASEKVGSTITEGLDKRSKLEAAQARTNAAANLLEVTAAHEEGRLHNDTLKEWSAAANQFLQSQVVVEARELDFVTSGALQAVVERNMSIIPAACSPTKPLSSSLQKQADALSDVSKKVQEVVKKARALGSSVWAVTEAGGRRRCARVRQLYRNIYLSALQEGDPPVYSHILPYEEVRRMMDDTCVRVFLEVSWEGLVQGRVCIRLLNNAPRTRQFFYLCSGERGPSYSHTNLLEVEGRGRPGERVWGGDYQNNDGSGGAALQGLTMGVLSGESVTAGLVASFSYDGGDHRKPAHFVIYNNDYPVTYEECPVGMTEEGLEVVRSAAKLDNVRDASITDCGIMLSL